MIKKQFMETGETGMSGQSVQTNVAQGFKLEVMSVTIQLPPLMVWIVLERCQWKEIAILTRVQVSIPQ